MEDREFISPAILQLKPKAGVWTREGAKSNAPVDNVYNMDLEGWETLGGMRPLARHFLPYWKACASIFKNTLLPKETQLETDSVLMLSIYNSF